MTYQQLLHFRIAGYPCGLRSGGMERFFGTRGGIFGKSGLMESKSLLLSVPLWRKINRIRTIGITPRGSRGTGETGIGYHLSFRRNVIRTVLDTVQLVHRHLIEVYHVAQDMIEARLLGKQKTAARHAMPQRNGCHRKRPIFINQGGFFRLERVEEDFIGHLMIEECSIGVRSSSKPLGECICRSAVRPKRLSVDISPSSPKQWSPCRWEMKIRFKRENLRRDFRNCNCAPSPQSIIKSLSRKFTTCEVGKWRVVGNAEPEREYVVRISP